MKSLLPALLSFFAVFSSAGFCQLPVHDDCSGAQKISIGESLRNLNSETFSAGLPLSRPATLPYTCVQSVENDQWFYFQTQAELEFYEVEIVTPKCNTPAGLQAMIIESEDCNGSQFKYRACASFNNTDTIRLYLKEPRGEIRFLIWVDGYDGAVCSFHLKLSGSKNEADPLNRFRYNRTSFSPLFIPEYPLAKGEVIFKNNAAKISWETEKEEDIRFFVVERLFHYPGENAFSTALNIVFPKNFVAEGKAQYSFTDEIGPFADEKKVWYRILMVNSKNEIFYGQPLELTPILIKGFFLNEIKSGEDNLSVRIHYLNFVKNSDFRFEVRDESGVVLKSLELDNQPIWEGNVDLNMDAFPQGNYKVRMICGNEFFDRDFFWEK